MAILAPTTASEIITAVNSDIADGDELHLPAGQFDCSATPLVTDKYFDVIGNQSNIRCNFTQTPSNGGKRIRWCGVTLDTTNNLAVADPFGGCAFYFNGANYEFTDCTFLGPCLSDVAIITVRAHQTTPMTAKFLGCAFKGSTSDLLTTTGGADQPTNAASFCNVIDCIAEDRGPGTSDQAYSGHDGVRMALHRCTYRNSDLSIDSRSSVAPGSSPAGGSTTIEVFDCDLVGKVSVAKMVGGRIRCTTGVALEPKLETGYGNFLFAAIDIEQTSGTIRGIQIDSTHSGQIESCYVQTPNVGNNAVYVTGSGTITILNNRFSGMANPVSTAAAAGGSILARNNICQGTTRANFQGAGATTTWNWDYNRISGAGNHVVGAHDFTAAPDIDAAGFPIAKGNCDGTGDPAILFLFHKDLANQPRLTSPRMIGPLEMFDSDYWQYHRLFRPG